MKVLFITGHKYLPQMHGGLQTCTDQLCHSLMERGHQVAVLAGLMPGGMFALMSRIRMKLSSIFSGHKLSKDRMYGYPVWRTWFPWEAGAYVAQKEKPDLIVVMAVEPVRMALAVKDNGIPLLMQLMDVELEKHGGDFRQLGDVACLANSQFTAQKYREAYGVNPAVIYPFIAVDDYKVETTRENVTFINPVPEKGRDIAIEIARRLPSIPFTFVEGWPLSDTQRRELMQNLEGIDNITLLPPQKDMHRIYGKCKILLVPSVWEEAYGRVATEAQISSIPVIASKRGGLPEAVGPGGVLIDPDGPVDAWVDAVRRLWQDNSYYVELSKASAAYARRRELSYTFQLEETEKVFLTACKKRA